MIFAPVGEIALLSLASTMGVTMHPRFGLPFDDLRGGPLARAILSRCKKKQRFRSGRRVFTHPNCGSVEQRVQGASGTASGDGSPESTCALKTIHG